MKTGIVWAFWGHEPIHHYRRLGSDRNSIFRHGRWIEAWYERLHEEATIRQASELGINVIYTHFYKGFGLLAEQAEMERTRTIVKLADSYGIQVLGYCQLNSLHYETMLDEQPDLQEWTARNADGSIVCWGSAYYRWSPCFNSDAFKAYMKRVIGHGLQQIGLNGFHFDNSYNKPCYCERCQQAFRDYLAKHVTDTETALGLKHVRHVRIPAFQEHAGTARDPLYQQWLYYRRELVASVHGELFGHVKALSDGQALVAHNPAFPRQYGHVNRIGYEPACTPPSVDFVFAENDGFIQFVGNEDKARHQVIAYKYGQLFGYRVLNSSWLKDEQGHIAIPRSLEQISLFEAEAMVFGGICGTPWLMRPQKQGESMTIDDSVQTEAAARIFHYFKRHEALYVRTEEVNSIKVLYHPDNLMLAMKQGYIGLSAVCQSLIAGGVPFSFTMLSASSALAKGDLLVVPHVDYMSDSELAVLRSLVEQGCGVVIIGPFATYDERGVEREREAELLPESGSVFAIASQIELSAYDSRKHFSGMMADTSQFAEPFMRIVKEHKAGTRVSCSIPGLLCETARDADGHNLLHLINPHNDTVLEQVTVTIEGEQVRDAYVELYTFEQARITAVESDAHRIQVQLASMQTLCTLRFIAKQP